MFKENDRRRFKCPNIPNVCGKLATDGGQITDPPEILSTFQKYFLSLSSSQIALDKSQEIITSLLQRSYSQCNAILEDDLDISEIRLAVKHLKCGKSAGPDGITAEHIKYGGLTVLRWLQKVFNRILSLEDIPPSLKEGIITPIYKGKGKDPLLATSYRGITISSSLSKLLELIILNRLRPFLDEMNVPDHLQTAYQKGLSCSDAIFATQEALLIHLREGGHPYLCLFDLEKAFDSIEHSVLLERLFEIGVNGRCWRIILNWYTSAQSKVHLNTGFSDPFSISRGVKQGSVLSPLLFLIAVDPLLKTLKYKHAGLSIHGNFIGGAAHADDLRTIATSKCSVVEQADIIDKFTSGNHLKLNSSKTEIIRIAYCHPQDDFISLFSSNIDIVTEGKCLGTWWKYNLSAIRSVQENIVKARRAFFAFGKIDAFQGHLNPLSAVNIFETCVIPVLLYGCDTWLLDSSTISLLEQFQYEIGRRILKVQKNTSGKVVRLCLNLPSMACRILIRKLTFLGKLLRADNSTISSTLFTAQAIVDPFIIQQCKMLEASLNIHVLDECLKCPETASMLVKSEKQSILESDMSSLIASALDHDSAHLTATVAAQISWNKLWDIALDRGTHGTSQLQRIVCHLSRHIYCGYTCSLCNLPIDQGTTWLAHLCTHHSVTLRSIQLSQNNIIDLLASGDDQIFNIHFPK